MTSSASAGSPAVIATIAVIIGIVLAGVILWLTGYFTGTEHKPVKTVGQTSLTGAATVILSGISIGFESAVYTAIVIGAAVYGAFLLSGSVTVALFAVALAGTGLLTTVGVIVAMDTFGPVSDNAQGIAEMSGDVSGEGAQILTELDAVGNTTKAITKGIAIATAVLAATALFGSYLDAITGALAKARRQRRSPTCARLHRSGVQPERAGRHRSIGAAVVFMFSGLAVNAVARAGRRGRLRGPAPVPRASRASWTAPQRPEYGKVVDICTRDSLRELATSRPARGVRPDRGRLRSRCRPAGRLPGRRHRHRHPDGDLPRQLRWCLGQRQEAGRGRQPRRQGLRRRTRRPSSVTPSATRSRTPLARPSTR